MSQESIASGKVKNSNIKKFLAQVSITQYICFPSARYVCMLYVVPVKVLRTLTEPEYVFYLFWLKKLYSDAQSLGILQ